MKNLWECKRFSVRRLVNKLSNKMVNHFPKQTLNDFLWKFRTSGLTEHIAVFVMILVLPSVVWKNIYREVKQFMHFCSCTKYSFLFPMKHKLEKSFKTYKSYGRNWSSTFFIETWCSCVPQWRLCCHVTSS